MLFGHRVAQGLDRAVSLCGKLVVLIAGNGLNFTYWAYEHASRDRFITQEPFQNCYIEILIDKLRDDCLIETDFLNLRDARGSSKFC